MSVVLPEPLRPTMATVVSGGISSVMSFEDGRRLGAAVAEAHLAKLMRPSSECTGVRRERSRPCSGSGSKMSSRRLSSTDDRCSWSHRPSSAHDRGVGQRHEGVERHERADG